MLEGTIRNYLGIWKLPQVQSGQYLCARNEYQITFKQGGAVPTKLEFRKMNYIWIKHSLEAHYCQHII